MAIVDTLQVVLQVVAERAVATLKSFDKQIGFAHSSFLKFTKDVTVQSQLASAAFLKGFSGVTGWLEGASPTFQAYMDIIGASFTDFSETVMSDTAPAMEAGSGAVQSAVDAFKGLPEPLRDAASYIVLFAAGLGLVSAAITLLSPLLGPMIGGLTSLAGLFSGVAGMLAYESALAGIETVSFGVGLSITAMGAIIAAVLAILVMAALGFKQAWDENLGWAMIAADWFSTGINGIFQGISTFVTGIWDTMTSLLRGDTEGTLKGLRMMFDGFVMFITGVFMTLVSTIAGFFLGLGTTLKNILTVFWDIGTGIVKAIVDGILSVAGQVGDALWSIIPEPIRGAISGAGSFTGGLVTGLTNMVGGLIPRFAEGGIVTKPTLAMVGENGPEAIVPLGGNTSGGGSPTYIISVYGAQIANDMDLNDLARKLAEKLHQQTSSTTFAFGTVR